MAPRREADQADTATRILDSAERLVQHRGFNGFSYADVASELGITKASLHYHFAGKAELGQALVERYAARFAAALEAIDADAELAWMVGDDIEGDVVGAQKHGMRTVLVRTGKFRPDELEQAGVTPDGIVSSIAQLPDWLEANL